MTDKKMNLDYKKVLKTLSKNYWTVSTVILAVVLILTLAIGGTGGSAISANAAGIKVADWANGQVENVEVVEVTDEGGLYAVKFSYANPETSTTEEATLQITKDGTNLILGQTIPLTGAVTQDAPTETPQTPTPTNAPKSDKPIVELFIMTHCPYGTQAEKGFLPVLESFDKADTKIRFVHYFMHEPEETETPRQVCIREEQSNKFLPYLREFLKEGNSEDALTAANIDTVKMETCISSGKADEYYAEDSALSQTYGVQGSPTLVINGVISKSGRDSASYLSAICSAFNNAPEECGTLTLSSTSPSPMWGWDDSGSNTQAQC